MSCNSQTSVSVIVLTYKQVETLNLIIQGLNQQTYPGNIEVVITDDGSPEPIAAKNVAILNRCKHPSKYVWQPDFGYRASAARNNGICLAKNELLIFLDGDIVPYPELISGHVEQHGVSNRIVAGNRTWIGEISGMCTFDELRRASPPPIAIARGVKENAFRHQLLNSTHPWRACFSANLSIRKADYVWFDERFVGWGPEDAEFCYRMCVRHGLIPIYDESIGSYHLESPVATGNVFRKNNHESIVNYIRNTFHFFDKCPGLELEDVFYGFVRLKLNQEANTWSVVPRNEVTNTNLDEIVKSARKWLQTQK